MAKKVGRPKANGGDENELPAQTNLAVDRVLADRIRDIAKETGTTTYEVTNRLIEHALEHGSIELERVKVVYKAKRGK